MRFTAPQVRFNDILLHFYGTCEPHNSSVEISFREVGPTFADPIVFGLSNGVVTGDIDPRRSKEKAGMAVQEPAACTKSPNVICKAPVFQYIRIDP
jgi:hypothetical protein